MLKGQIGNYEYTMLRPMRWEVRRSGFLMAVHSSGEEAVKYCQRKHDDES